MTTITAPTTVFFGDSLSDDGNLYDLFAGVVPEAALEGVFGPTDSFSDGQTFAEYAGAELGGETANYAFGSGEAIGSETLGELVASFGLEDLLLVPDTDPILEFDINLTAQVDRFLTDTAGQDLSQTTAFVLIGANDYRTLLGSDIATIIANLSVVRDEAVAAAVAAAETLAAAGVGDVVLMTLPAPEYFPFNSDLSGIEATVAASAFADFNALLTAEIEALAALGESVEVLDLAPITDAIAGAPDAYGFVAPYDLTFADGAGDLFDDEQIAFWDDIHPSTANHAIVGAYVAAVTEGARVVEGAEGAETLTGAAGVDVMLGNDGGDLMFGRAGDDVINGHDGDDDLRGQDGDDLVSGGSGSDFVSGANGWDVLSGGAGDDLIYGLGGSDVIVDGLGSDLARGGKGNDSFVWVEAVLLGGAAGDLDTIQGSGGTDTIYIVLSEDTFAAQSAAFDAAALGIDLTSIEEIVLLDGLDALDAVEDAPWTEAADMWGLI